MNKGIVMEASDQHVIVMTPAGTFHKLPRDGRKCDVGEEILFAQPPSVRRMPPLAKISGLAAAAVIAFVVFTGVNWSAKADVVAYVSMDINPSVEFSINAAEKVVSLKGLNDDGSKLIAGVDYKGKALENVAEELLDKAEQQGPLAKGEGDIIIASSLAKNTDEINDTAIADKLKEQVQKHIQADHPDQAANYEVTAFAAPLEIRTAAEENGLSMGKYALYLTAKGNGMDLPLDSFKTESVHDLAKSNGGIEAFVNPQQPPIKAQLKQLLQEEKSGKLDELAKQLAEQKGKASDNGADQKQVDKNDNKSAAGKNDDKNTKQTDKKDNKNDQKRELKKDDKESNAKPTSSKPADGNAAQDSYIKKGESDNQRVSDSDSRKHDKNKSDDSSDSEKKTNHNKTNFDNGDSKEKKHNDDHGDDGGSD